MKSMPRKRSTGKVTNVWRKKTYGPVRPVRQAKAAPKYAKPSVRELKVMYTELAKLPDWQHLDRLQEIIHWFRSMSLSAWQDKDVPLSVAKLHLRKREWEEKLKATSDGKDRIRCSLQIIAFATQEAKLAGFQVPDITTYWKKGLVAAKKLAKHQHLVEVRYDKVLTMLSAAIPLDIKLGAIPVISQNGKLLVRKYDLAADTMFYSRNHLKELKQKIRKEGILPVAIQEGFHLSRAVAARKALKETGKFLPSGDVWLQYFVNALQGFATYVACNPDAPNRIVAKKVAKKKVL